MVLLADEGAITFMAKGTMFFTFAYGQGSLQFGANADDEVPLLTLALIIFGSLWAAETLRMVRAQHAAQKKSPPFSIHEESSFHLLLLTTDDACL